MAKLVFRYGAMGASKTANAIMVAFNYEERHKKALVVKPEADTRSGFELSSRIGITWPAVSMQDVKNLCKQAEKDGETGLLEYDAVIVDEAQFLAAEEVELLAWIVDTFNIPVLCYGLKTNFKSELFAGSKRLIELADEIEEIPTICWCGRKARFNARIDNLGNVITDGPELMVGWNNKYMPLCRKHYVNYQPLEH